MVANIAHDRLIVYEKERENDISEEDIWIASKLKVIVCGYLTTNINKQLKFKI